MPRLWPAAPVGDDGAENADVSAVAPVRTLTITERFKWGECRVCNAQHGEPCLSTVGIPIGFTPTGEPPKVGAHLVRLWDAPRRVREVPV